jgi:hypothetical protein
MASVMHALGLPRESLAGPDGRPHAIYGGKPIEPLFV